MGTILDFQKIFDTYATQTEKTWVHDRSSTVGASEAFGCLRKTWYSKNAWPQDPDYKQSYGAIRRGDMIENHYVVPAVTNNLPLGCDLLFAGGDQRTLVDGFLSATPDGLITNLTPDALSPYGIEDIESDCILLEIKSVDPRVNMDEEKAIHRGQVNVQAGLIHATTNHRPEYGAIVYVNASFVDDIKTFVIKRDPAVFEAAKKRANMVFRAKAAKDLPAEGKIMGGKDCQFCPFQNSCQGAILNAVPTEKKTAMFATKDEQELLEIVRRRQGLKMQLKDLEAEETAVTEALKEKLRQLETRYAKIPGYIVTYSTQAGRKTIDTKAMAEDGIDLEPYEKMGLGFEKLTVKAIDD